MEDGGREDYLRLRQRPLTLGSIAEAGCWSILTRKDESVRHDGK